MLSSYLSRTAFEPPPYAEMAARNALMRGTTEASYNASVANLRALRESMQVSAITYESDGLRVTGMEVLPAHAEGETLPLMIYNRGGSGDYGMLSAGQVTALMAPFASALRAGVLASNYRGNGGSEGREEFGGADVRDVLALLALGKQQPWWDGKNVFMLGWSRGGMMTYRALQEGAVVNAAAVGAGIADLALCLDEQPDMEELCHRRIPHFAQQREAALAARSAVCWPEMLHAPLLLLHGDADDRVSATHARRLHTLLVERGHAVKYVEYAGGDHALKRHWKQWVAETVAWFTQHRR